MEHAKYCPFCCRDIDPCCDENGDVIGSEYTGFVYVHDDVEHDEDWLYSQGELH